MGWWPWGKSKEEREREANGELPRPSDDETAGQADGSPYRRPPELPPRAWPPPELELGEPRPAHELPPPAPMPHVPPPPPVLRSVPPRLVEEDHFFLAELMSDPAEMKVAAPFLSGRPPTAAERAAYSQFLLGRGDVRGEVLALLNELALDPPPPDAERQRARLSELQPRVKRSWFRLMTEVPYLLNCGMARQHPPSVRFAFQCPRSWEELTPTDDQGVRHCGGCGEDVHRVDTLVAADQLARQRKCIAVPSPLAEQGGYPEGKPLMLGRPEHPVLKWSTRLFGERPFGGE